MQNRPTEESSNFPSARHLEQVSDYWNLDGECERLRYVTNHVFAAERAGERCVIRLSHATTRQPEQLESEFAFSEAVAASGIFVMLPWKSKSGNRIESVSCRDGETFHASVFPFAPGSPARGLNALTAPVLREWGETLARLHSVSEHYRAPAGVIERSAWNEEAVFLTALSSVNGETTDRNELTESVNRLHRLQESGMHSQRYGTIHADVHGGNFFINDGKLVLFDFDDSCRHWFLYDLAVSVTSLMQARRGQNADDSALQACDDLFGGYSLHRNISAAERILLHSFIRYRLLLIRLWWKGRMECELGSNELEAWGIEFDPWSRAASNGLPLLLS